MRQDNRSGIDRREFMRRTGAIAVGTGLGASAVSGVHAQQASRDPEWRNKQPGMRYRRLGRTNFMVSEIGFGGSGISFDNIAMVDRAIERGLNYIDTSSGYREGQSEPALGKLLKGAKRDKVFLATKAALFLKERTTMLRARYNALPAAERQTYAERARENVAKRAMPVMTKESTRDDKKIRQIVQAEIDDILEREGVPGLDRSEYTKRIVESVQGSAKRLQTDCIDVIIIPGRVSMPSQVDLPEVHEAFEKLKKAGTVRFLGVATHANIHDVLTACIENGKYDVLMPAYNALNHGDLDDVLKQAAAKDVGVVVMKALAPFLRRGEVDDRVNELVKGGLSPYQKAYRWVLENPNVACVISAMKSREQVDHNIGIPTMKLGLRDRKALERFARARAAEACAMCASCAKACPARIPIPDILRFGMYADGYGEVREATQAYAGLAPEQTVAACLDCGACERACPNGVPIRQRINAIHSVLA